jgi:peptidoglycan L-alanyl-D-glutamate endopeptidase CwlK
MPITLRDQQRLVGVHPTLVAAIRLILGELPMFVVNGVRTQAEQAALYAQGRTTPGHIVTHCDGVTTRSNHQIHPSDRLGHAVDCAFIGPDPFAASHDWAAYGSKVQALGLIWGGSWKSIVDQPHAELP